MNVIFRIIVLLDFLLLSLFTIIYLAGKDAFLILGSLFVLSSLVYAAIASISVALTRLIGHTVGRMRDSYSDSLSIGLAVAATIHSIIFYLIFENYWNDINVLETLGVLLEASNMYVFMASYIASLSIDDTTAYAIINVLTLSLVPRLLLARFSIDGEGQGVLEIFKKVTVAVALAIKPLEYIILVLWLVFLFL